MAKKTAAAAAREPAATSDVVQDAKDNDRAKPSGRPTIGNSTIAHPPEHPASWGGDPDSGHANDKAAGEK